LRLDDIDWQVGEIVVRGKGRRTERLPLRAGVGEAIVAYVRCGRADTRPGDPRCDEGRHGRSARDGAVLVIERAALGHIFAAIPSLSVRACSPGPLPKPTPRR
jgi:hypothetical protein